MLRHHVSLRSAAAQGCHNTGRIIVIAPALILRETGEACPPFTLKDSPAGGVGTLGANRSFAGNTATELSVNRFSSDGWIRVTQGTAAQGLKTINNIDQRGTLS